MAGHNTGFSFDPTQFGQNSGQPGFNFNSFSNFGQPDATKAFDFSQFQDSLNINPDALGNGDKGFFGDFNFGNFANGTKGLASLLGAFGSLKGLGLAEDQLQLNKDATIGNFNNNVALTNQQLATQQDTRRRTAINNGNPDRFQDPALQLATFGNG